MSEVVSFREWKNPPHVRALLVYRVREAQRAEKALKAYKEQTRKIADKNGDLEFFYAYQNSPQKQCPFCKHPKTAHTSGGCENCPCPTAKESLQ